MNYSAIHQLDRVDYSTAMQAKPSEVTSYDDGSFSITEFDGTIIEVSANQDTFVSLADGTYIEAFADGDVRVNARDGTIFEYYMNGDLVTTWIDNSQYIEFADGFSIEWRSDGTRVCVDPAGDVTLVDAGGTIWHESASGASSVFHAPGSQDSNLAIRSRIDFRKLFDGLTDVDVNSSRAILFNCVMNQEKIYWSWCNTTRGSPMIAHIFNDHKESDSLIGILNQKVLPTPNSLVTPISPP